MKKTLTLATLLIAVFFLSGCSSSDQALSTTSQNVMLQTEATPPTRAAEINGIISSIEGNEIIIKKEIGGEVLTEAQMAQKKADRQKMSETERQALRANEVSGLKTEDVKMNIPVGVAIFKADGTGTGKVVKGELNEIKKGAYLSIWMNAENVEAVKIKGLN